MVYARNTNGSVTLDGILDVLTDILAALDALTPTGALVVDTDGRTINSNESGTVYSNEGASALDVFTLPTALADLRYSFIVQDADGIKVVAGAGDTIRIGSSASAVAGYVQSTTVGSTLMLIAINATEWVALAAGGTWVVV